MRVCILQPTYLPWAGYFHIMSRSDLVVFLDDVQFDRGSWQTRNRILLNGSEHMLTVHVKKAPRNTPIEHIEINFSEKWWVKHIQTLTLSYKKSPYGHELLEILSPIFENEPHLLLKIFTQKICKTLAESLGINSKFISASELNCPGTRSEHLLEICKKVGASHYLSPQGSRDYLNEDGFANNKEGIKLEFSQFQPKPYPQSRTSQFISHLSIVDVIAHLGLDGAKEYIQG